MVRYDRVAGRMSLLLRVYWLRLVWLVYGLMQMCRSLCMPHRTGGCAVIFRVPRQRAALLEYWSSRLYGNGAHNTPCVNARCQITSSLWHGIVLQICQHTIKSIRHKLFPACTRAMAPFLYSITRHVPSYYSYFTLCCIIFKYISHVINGVYPVADTNTLSAPAFHPNTTFALATRGPKTSIRHSRVLSPAAKSGNKQTPDFASYKSFASTTGVQRWMNQSMYNTRCDSADCSSAIDSTIWFPPDSTRIQNGVTRTTNVRQSSSTIMDLHISKSPVR